MCRRRMQVSGRGGSIHVGNEGVKVSCGKFTKCKVKVQCHGEKCWGNHEPLKLRIVHLSDSTIIYESKVSVQNVFPGFKGTIMSRPHAKFQINSSFQ
jgi:hypothetical protein